jgi:hypothetical protein
MRIMTGIRGKGRKLLPKTSKGRENKKAIPTFILKSRRNNSDNRGVKFCSPFCKGRKDTRREATPNVSRQVAAIIEYGKMTVAGKLLPKKKTYRLMRIAMSVANMYIQFLVVITFFEIVGYTRKKARINEYVST